MPPEGVLVTGAAGYLASGLIPALLAGGYRVTGLIRPEERAAFDLDIEAAAGEPGKDGAATRAVAEADVILHLAGIKGYESCARNIKETVAANIGLTQRILAVMEKKPVRVILASTYWVYGPKAPLPYVEDGPLMPAEPYGWSKALAEGQLRTAGFDYAIVRLANVFGYRPGKDYREVASLLMERALRGEPIALRNAGVHRLDLIGVDTVCDILVKLVGLKDARLVVNVGSGRPVSLQELAAMVNAVAKNLTGKEATVNLGPREADEVLFADRWVDISRLKARLAAEIPALEASLEQLGRDLLAAGVA